MKMLHTYFLERTEIKKTKLSPKIILFNLLDGKDVFTCNLVQDHRILHCQFEKEGNKDHFFLSIGVI